MQRNRLKDLERFYAILDELGRKLRGARMLSACSGRMDWPIRGVYFFQEPEENRAETGSGPRVVRVGTHALKAGSGTTLWNRLSQHRGSNSSRGGNHRGSIFRLLVGRALLARNNLACQTWGQGGSAPRDIRDAERLVEKLVSAHIGGMPFLWVAVEDEPGPTSLRGHIERNSIALLSNFNGPLIDPPSRNWLGHHCARDRVRKSGLWNQNHVEEDYDPKFLDIFASLVAAMREAS